MQIIFTLFVADYICTYIGIHLHFIIEANPLMSWLFTYGFVQGLIIRIVMVVILLIPFCICKNKNITFYRKAIVVVLIFYMPVMVLHLSWILQAINS